MANSVNKKSNWKLLLVLFVTIIVLAISGMIYYKSKLNKQNLSTEASLNDENTEIIANADANISDNAQIYKKDFSPSEGFGDLVEFVMPAVVSITSIKIVKTQGNDIPLDAVDPAFRELFKNLLPQQSPKKQRFVGVGTGFVIRSDGFIVTNYHVIQESETIQVTFSDEKKYVAKIYAYDEFTDLAVLKIDETNLPTLKLGDSNKVRVGDVVIAIGNPYGLEGTVSSGIISAKSRSIGFGMYSDYLQTDAAINKGNSGGPMINTQGEVIGINTAIFSTTGGGSIGIGFALPADTIHKVVNQLITNKKVVRSWLGVQIQGINENIAKSLDVKDTQGALVTSVVAGSPAEEAGVKTGDVIITVNDVVIKNSAMLPKIISNIAPGTTITLGVISNNTKKSLKVVLKPIPSNLNQEKNNQDSLDSGIATEEIKENSYDDIGIKVAQINDAIRKYFGFAPNVNGIVILAVKTDSIAQEKGLEGGIRILEVNKQKVETLEQFDKLIKSPKNNSWLFLTEIPSRGSFYISITQKEIEQGYTD